MPVWPVFASRQFAEGVKHWRQAEPFEAHEAWEALWMTAVGKEKLQLQGLIQLAAGWVKLHRENARGARSLLTKGLAKIETDARFAWWPAPVNQVLALVRHNDLPAAKQLADRLFPRLPLG